MTRKKYALTNLSATVANFSKADFAAQSVLLLRNISCHDIRPSDGFSSEALAGQNSRANVSLLHEPGNRAIHQLCRCDAEPGALADYILALLKHNVPESEMRKELAVQLDEFLEKGAFLSRYSFCSFSQ